MIYQKEPLSLYKNSINNAAGDICVPNPTMLTKRGNLLEAARVCVDQSGYQYKKKRSRSKVFGVVHNESDLSKWPKYSKTMRSERYANIQVLTTLNKHIILFMY